jgi:hypothetical protein
MLSMTLFKLISQKVNFLYNYLLRTVDGTQSYKTAVISGPLSNPEAFINLVHK